MTQKSKVYKKNEHQKILVFQCFYLLERLLLMDATAAINGIQEVVGSIPIISTTTQPVCVTGWVCIWARGSVGRALRSHRRGQGFESLQVHQLRLLKKMQPLKPLLRQGFQSFQRTKSSTRRDGDAKGHFRDVG